MLGQPKREKVNPWCLYEPSNTSKTQSSLWVDYKQAILESWLPFIRNVAIDRLVFLGETHERLATV